MTAVAIAVAASTPVVAVVAEELTSGPDPEPRVEYDSIATRGSMPKAAAVSAEVMAMAARSLAEGLTLTAQSPYTSTCRRHVRRAAVVDGMSRRHVRPYVTRHL